jgi:hypothetical protein
MMLGYTSYQLPLPSEGERVTVWQGDTTALSDFLLYCYACVCFINKPKHVAPVEKQTILPENTFVINDAHVRFLRVPFCLYFFL